MSGKYSQKLLDHAKKSATDAIKTLQQNSQQNNSQTVTNEHYKEIPKEKYVSPEERQEIIEELKLR